MDTPPTQVRSNCDGPILDLREDDLGRGVSRDSLTGVPLRGLRHEARSAEIYARPRAALNASGLCRAGGSSPPTGQVARPTADMRRKRIDVPDSATESTSSGGGIGVVQQSRNAAFDVVLVRADQYESAVAAGQSTDDGGVGPNPVRMFHIHGE